MRGATLALALAAFQAPAYGARPFFTDDARIVDPGGCQIESYARQQRKVHEDELWFLPGCTPGSNIEFTLGALKLDNAASGTSSMVAAQAKTLLRPLAMNGYGVALTLGMARQNPVDPPASPRNLFFNLIGSLSLRDNGLVLHGNVGATQDRIADRARHTWGIGGEIALGGRLQGIAEAYNQEGERPSKQIGLRYWIIPDRFQIDGTYGWQKSNQNDRAWTSLGVRILY
jgi:hypothetical protein